MFPEDRQRMSPEQYVRHLETQGVVVNLERAERDQLVSGLKSGVETQETVRLKMQMLKEQKLQDALSEIVKILDGGESEGERIRKARAAAVRTLFVPTF